jgi:hypothetical protein
MEEPVPAGHIGGRPLYGSMMKSIDAGHTFGNRVRMIKLPLIFLDEERWAGAITQFFFLSEALEKGLAQHAAHPMVIKLKELGLEVTPGYASDLCEVYGAEWRSIAEREKTTATACYVEILQSADPVQLCAAAFILYGALVVGGGKQTQAKVKSIFPRIEHKLFDVADDMKGARQKFKNIFTAIGKEFPEHFETMEREAARFMLLNNCVVLSIRCWSSTATKMTLTVAAVSIAAVATAVAFRRLAR